MQTIARCTSARCFLPGLVLALALTACAPVEPFGEASGEDADEVRDGREAAEDAARRIAALGAGVARQIGNVARNLQPMAEGAGDKDEVATPALEKRE